MDARRDFLMTMAMMSMEAEADHDTIYIPERHIEKDRGTILDFMEEYAFAMVVTAKNGIHITNVPTLLERTAEGWGKVWFHLAKGNKQNASLDGLSDTVVVFHGPHGYISPNWYNSKNSVPTWNFAVVHATGKARRLDDDAAFAESLKRLVGKNEALYGGGTSWDYAKMPDSYLKGMRQGIVAYEMTIEGVEAKFKLGHERSAADREGVLKGMKGGRRERDLLEFTRAYYGRLKG